MRVPRSEPVPAAFFRPFLEEAEAAAWTAAAGRHGGLWKNRAEGAPWELTDGEAVRVELRRASLQQSPGPAGSRQGSSAPALAPGDSFPGFPRPSIR